MLMGRAGLSPVMVGRGEELAALQARVETLAGHRGLPPVAVVSGEAGVGKTRLLRELTTALGSATPAVRVLAGHGEEGGDTRPFGLLVEAVRQDVSAWSEVPQELSARAHALGHVLSPLLPEHPPSMDHQHAADELHLAAVDAVRHVVGPGPAVLLFEDLHWADAESIGLFARLATTEDLPVLLVGTYRPEDFDRRHPLARALPTLERTRTVTHLALGRLDGPDLARMLEAALGTAVPSATVEVLHRRTQGNPFFVEELVASAPDLDPGTIGRAPLPWNAAEAVLRRVDELEPLRRQALEAAAVLGGRVPFDRLANVTGLDEDTLIEVLRELVERGLLREEEPDVFEFRHALTREAVAGQLLGREQRRLHRAALAAIDAEGDDAGPTDLAAIARHAAGAGDWERLTRTALEGAPRLRLEGSARHAQALAELALERCEELSDADAMTLYALAAGSAWEVGALETAQRHAQRWQALAAAAGDLESESAALRRLWHVRFELGDRTGADEALQQAQVAAEALGPSVELAWVQSYVSQRHMLAQEHAEAVAWADRALTLAEEVGAPEVVPFALVNKGTVLTETGRREEGLTLLDEARRTALARHDGATAARALNNAIVHLIEFSDNADRARHLLDEWDEILERFGQEGYRPNATVHRVTLALIDGDAAAARRSIERVDDVEVVAMAGILAGHHGLIEAETGDPQVALAALPPLPRPESVRGMEDAEHALGRLALGVRVRDMAAVEAAIDLLLVAQHTDDADSWWPLIGPTAAILATPLARIDEQRLVALLATADRTPVPPRSSGDPGLAAHAWAGLHARRGEHHEAIAAYRRAEDLRERPRPAFLRADREMGLARSLAAIGERDQAVAHAAAAVELLARWPGWRREEARELHSRLTVASADGHGSLTPRETEVLALVAEGMSNREIGEHLYITTKTAAVHVSNILAKVGAASRTEAAAWAVRSGALPPPGAS